MGTQQVVRISLRTTAQEEPQSEALEDGTNDQCFAGVITVRGCLLRRHAIAYSRGHCGQWYLYRNDNVTVPAGSTCE